MSTPLSRALLLLCLFAPTRALLAQQVVQQTTQQHRPPAVPLITHNPYFSVWSDNDKLTDGSTRHWTGSDQAITSLVQVDGKPYRIMGDYPRDTPPMEQTALRVQATHTVYTFRGAGIELELSFFTPAFPQDLDLLSRPVTYITWTAKATDGAQHTVNALLDVNPEIAVDRGTDAVTWGRSQTGALDVLNVGSRDQRVLDKSGDNLRIDWGYFHLAVPRSGHGVAAAVGHNQLDKAQKEFAGQGTITAPDSMDFPAMARDSAAHLDAVVHLGSVGATAASQHVLVSYTDNFAIEYLNQRLKPWWQRNNQSISTMLDKAEQQYTQLDARGLDYDKQLDTDMTAAGGADYSYLTNLAYRESLAACELTADTTGTPLYFCKENFSNGCTGTVDVMYPQSPILLFFNPALMEAQMEPVLRYSALPRWKFPFSPHDVGQYPLANGQVYGGGEQTEDDQQPVEESGNMLIMADALAHIQGNAHLAEQYWAEFTRWADYLQREGRDPVNQLSTDDFAGHLAHQENLTVKAILGVGAYADLAHLLGREDVAKQYRGLAEGMVKQFFAMGVEGDHTKLAFDKPGTWSQKYNLVWDRLLGLKLFPPAFAESEVKWYIAHENRYGFPLDSRKDYTKLDWELWSATMASDKAQFQQMIAPLAKWADETPSRVPMTDWYDTKTGKQESFQARSVVGGLFIKALADENLAKKWRALGAVPAPSTATR